MRRDLGKRKRWSTGTVSNPKIVPGMRELFQAYPFDRPALSVSLELAMT